MVLPRICYGNLTEYLLSLGLPTVGSHPLVRLLCFAYEYVYSHARAFLSKYTQICNGLAYLHQLDIVGHKYPLEPCCTLTSRFRYMGTSRR